MTELKAQEQRIIKVCDNVRDTLIRKNSDYGDAFSKRFAKHGILSAFIRMEDKWFRLDNLISGGEQKVKDESIEDTLRDLAGYISLTLVELGKRKEQEDVSNK